MNLTKTRSQKSSENLLKKELKKTLKSAKSSCAKNTTTVLLKRIDSTLYAKAQKLFRQAREDGFKIDATKLFVHALENFIELHENKKN